jgi:hypothetical protein
MDTLLSLFPNDLAKAARNVMQGGGCVEEGTHPWLFNEQPQVYNDYPEDVLLSSAFLVDPAESESLTASVCTQHHSGTHAHSFQRNIMEVDVHLEEEDREEGEVTDDEMIYD